MKNSIKRHGSLQQCLDEVVGNPAFYFSLLTTHFFFYCSCSEFFFFFWDFVTCISVVLGKLFLSVVLFFLCPKHLLETRGHLDTLGATVNVKCLRINTVVHMAPRCSGSLTLLCSLEMCLTYRLRSAHWQHIEMPVSSPFLFPSVSLYLSVPLTLSSHALLEHHSIISISAKAGLMLDFH